MHCNLTRVDSVKTAIGIAVTIDQVLGKRESAAGDAKRSLTFMDRQQQDRDASWPAHQERAKRHRASVTKDHRSSSRAEGKGA